jgi:hypothetical protein
VNRLSMQYTGQVARCEPNLPCFLWRRQQKHYRWPNERTNVQDDVENLNFVDAYIGYTG